MFYLIAGQLLWGKNGGFGTALYSSWVLSDIILYNYYLGDRGNPSSENIHHPCLHNGVSFIAVSMDHDLLSHKDLLDTTVAQQLDTFRQNSISSSRKREEKKGKSYLRVVILVLLFLVHPGTQTILVYSLFHLQIST